MTRGMLTMLTAGSVRSLPLGAVAALIVAMGAAVPAAAQVGDVPETPSVTGPITGPGPMHPGIRPGPDGTNLEDFDYEVTEYFVSGTAGPDDRSYEVRVLVRAPANPKKASGHVIYEPMHRGGNDLICQYARYGIGQRGHICVGVAARPINLSNPATPGAGLHDFNQDRYGSLHVSSDQTNEVLAQVAWLLRGNHPDSPLSPEYPVERIVMAGTSDSSGATRSYMGSVHNETFRAPGGGPIVDGFFLTSTLGGSPVEITDVPTIQMPTQSEVHNTDAYRRPDSDDPANRFRIYEPAGMSHNDSRDQPPGVFENCTHPLSQFPYGAMTFMGLQHVFDWTHGSVPPRADYIEVDGDLSDGTRVALDEFGNAKGGVRTPHLDVPVTSITIPNSGPGLCSQTGYEYVLPDEVLSQLYRNDGQYVSKFVRQLNSLTRDGWWPREYFKRYGLEDMRRHVAELP